MVAAGAEVEGVDEDVGEWGLVLSSLSEMRRSLREKRFNAVRDRADDCARCDGSVTGLKSPLGIPRDGKLRRGVPY